MRRALPKRLALAKRLAHRKPVAVLSALVLVALILSGCGDRLTTAQRDAAAVGASTGSGSPSAGNGTTASTALGSTTGATTPGGASTATTLATGATNTGGSNTTGNRGSTSGSPGGSSTNSSGTHSSGVVSSSTDPLAGPGGKICPAGAPGSGPGVTSSTITIGNISTVNGPVPALFVGAQHGIEAFAAYVNSTGGLCGRKLVVQAEDDQFDQATDQAEAQSMAHNILSFVGSFSLQDSGIASTASEGVPDVGETLTAARAASPMNFNPQPNPPGFQTGSLVYLKQDPRYAAATQHMAVLVEDTAQTLTDGEYLEAALKSIGYHIVFSDNTLQPTDPTFNGDVQKMKADGVTGVAFEATASIDGELAAAMYQAGMNIKINMLIPSAYDPAYLQAAGPGAAGTVLESDLAMFEGQDAASVPMISTFDEWYARVNPGQVPDIFAAYAWVAGILFAEGLNAGGAATRSALLDGLRSITSFNADGMQSTTNPAGKVPASCWMLIDAVQSGGSYQFKRDPATPSGFRCSPSGYYHYP